MARAAIPTWVAWSSGKDSAWALHRLSSDRRYRVTALLTTVTDTFDRVSIHGVRADLLRAQARRRGLPVHEVRIPYPCPNAVYEEAMGTAVAQARREGVRAIAFGDLFLEDVRRYREDRLRGTGIAPIFPLWGEPTRELARTMLRGGLRAKVVCVDRQRLDGSFVGREFDTAFLASLPPTVDPCGERGEFHTFVYRAPEFRRPIHVRSGGRVTRDGCVFAELEGVRPSSARRARAPAGR